MKTTRNEKEIFEKLRSKSTGQLEAIAASLALEGKGELAEIVKDFLVARIKGDPDFQRPPVTQ